MAKSLKSLLSKINLVDIVVVLVLIAVLMCLMKKMDVVEGLCVANDRGNADDIKRCERYDEESECNIDRCQWVSGDLVEIEQMQPGGMRLPRLETPDTEQLGNCILNYRQLHRQGYDFSKSDVRNYRLPLASKCRGATIQNCNGVGHDHLNRGACCIEDPDNLGECI